VVGSRLVESPEFAEAIFFALGESAAAGIDAREGRVAISGWTETSDVSAEELAHRMESLGARHFVLTDIARDGALTGPNVEFFRQVGAAIGGKFIASGGISDLYDFELMAEARIPHLEGVIVGRALYEGRFTLAQAKAAVDRAFENSPIAGDVSL
jgi:phosphoribosylformimino-5-aminoimidazole carboxamide ribotide isomerase